MSEDIIEQLVEEIYEEELNMINRAITKLSRKQDEFEKETKLLEEKQRKVNWANDELEKEREKLNNQIGISEKEIKIDVEKVSEERVMAQKLVDKCEKQYRELEKECEKIKKNREELARELKILNQKIEQAKNIRLKNGIEQLSKMDDLTPEAKEIINSLID